MQEIHPDAYQSAIVDIVPRDAKRIHTLLNLAGRASQQMAIVKNIVPALFVLLSGMLSICNVPLYLMLGLFDMVRFDLGSLRERVVYVVQSVVYAGLVPLLALQGIILPHYTYSYVHIDELHFTEVERKPELADALNTVYNNYCNFVGKHPKEADIHRGLYQLIKPRELQVDHLVVGDLDQEKKHLQQDLMRSKHFHNEIEIARDKAKESYINDVLERFKLGSSAKARVLFFLHQGIFGEIAIQLRVKEFLANIPGAPLVMSNKGNDLAFEYHILETERIIKAIAEYKLVTADENAKKYALIRVEAHCPVDKKQWTLKTSAVSYTPFAIATDA